LIADGDRILARRFRAPLGEIDMMARRRGVLGAVQVKASANFDAAAEAIGKCQQSISAAQLWRAARPQDAMRDMRFDVVLLVPGRLPRHLQAAFDASL
jgi:putative endonuclease